MSSRRQELLPPPSVFGQKSRTLLQFWASGGRKVSYPTPPGSSDSPRQRQRAKSLVPYFPQQRQRAKSLVPYSSQQLRRAKSLVA